MMREAIDMFAVAFAGSVMVLGASSPIAARDFGAVGQTFPVIETDLLSTIETRLRRADASGDLARVNGQFAKRAEAKVRRPTPVAGLAPTEHARAWDFDPTVTIGHDIRDQKGNLIASAGQRVNPLDFVVIRQDLVFVDGDDASQLEWATKRFTDTKAKIIFVNGSPFETMTRAKRRFYFDQEGKLTQKFGIEHTPAIVSRAGRVMRVSEVVVTPGKTG